MDLTVDDGPEPTARMGPAGPSVEQERVHAFAKIMSNYRREAKRPRPDDDVVDVVDLTTI